MSKKGMLIVVSGPSGSGKGTVVARFRQLYPEIGLSVSATTRAPREILNDKNELVTETDGVQYYFISRNDFEDAVAHGEMLEHTVYCGNYYGTPKREAERIVNSGKDLILEIEVNGGGQVKRLFPDAINVMLIPPSAEALEARLRGRNTESESSIAERLARAKEEMLLIPTYDYVLINEDGKIDECAHALMDIIRAEHHRTGRNLHIMDSFFS